MQLIVRQSKDGRPFVQTMGQARTESSGGARYHPLGKTMIRVGDRVTVDEAMDGIALVNGEPWSTDAGRARALELYAGVVESKKIRLRMGDLRAIMTEAKRGRMDTYLRVIDEAPEFPAADTKSHDEGASGDSLDSQVDKYINQYESDAKKSDDAGTEGPMGGPGAAQMEAIDWRDLVKGVLIESDMNQAGQGDKDTQGPDDAAPGADDLTGEDTDKLTLENLDVSKFCDDVVRLIENYDSLLEVKATLMRRARNFLQKNYNDEVLSSFDDVMRDDHGMVPGMDKQSIDDERFPAPPAARAAGSAQAGPGGGGGTV